MTNFRFFYPIEIRYADLDPQGHVNNARFLTYFEQARVNYLIHLGLFDKNQSFMEIGIILADAHVTFKEPLYFRTDAQVGVRISRIGNKSMQMEYTIRDMDTGLEVASGATTVVTYDYASHQTIPVPASWREAIAKFENL
ncbi:MAG: thioesterase family protein [Anaerolineales bacterium]